MQNALFTFTLQLGWFLPILLLCGIAHRKVNSKFIAGALVVMLADVMVVLFPRAVPGFYFEGQHWNWFGKAAEILLGIGIFILVPRLREVTGFELFKPPGQKKWIALLFAVLISGGLFIGFMNPSEPFNLQTMLFQLFMPSISEEIIYRGILFALFLRAFNGPRQALFAALLVTAWFGIIHGVGIEHGSVHFDVASLIVSAIVGGLLMLLRILSKSLFFPMVGHSLYNSCIHIVAVFWV